MMGLPEGQYRFDKFFLDPLNLRLTANGQNCALEPKSFRLLLFLIENRNRVVPKEEILSVVWEGVAVSDNALTRAVVQIRKALDDDPKQPRYIETVPTVGYRFAAVVEVGANREHAPMSDVTPVDRILKRSLATDPDHHFQTARDLSAALDLALEKPPVKTSVRARSFWGMVAAVAGVAAIVLAILWWRAAVPQTRPLMRFSFDLGPDAVVGPRVTAAISPDGMLMAFVARGPNGKQLLATRRFDQEGATLLADTEDAADPFFSPNGEWIGFFADQNMKKVSVKGGAAVTICETGDARGASWGEDGSIVFTPRPSISGLWRVPEAGGSPQTLTIPTNEYSHRWPQILPGGKAVLFTSMPLTGHWEDNFVGLLSLKTGQRKALVRNAYSGRYLPTSNGAGHLVYVREGTLFGVRFNPNRSDVEGTPVPLVENLATQGDIGSADFAFSPSGAMVYRRSGSQATPMVMLDDAGKIQPLPLPANFGVARFSPDGKLLVLQTNVSSGDLYVYDRQHERTTRLTNSRLNSNPVWSPDGRYVVFQNATPSGSFSLQAVRADGASEPQTLMEATRQLIPDSFSPNGKNLAITTDDPVTDQDIWILPLDTNVPEHPRPGKPQPFVQSRGVDVAPAFSPDGKWLAYGSSESGRSEVYVRSFPAPADGNHGPKWQISVSGGNRPAWSRTAPELFFTGPDNRIMVAKFKTSPQSFDAGKPRVWSASPILALGGFGWMFDLAPDGRHAIAVVDQGDAVDKTSIHVNVLLNFFDEVRRRLPLK